MAPSVLVTPRSMTAAGIGAITALEPLRAAGFDLISGPPGRLPRLDDLRVLAGDVVGWVAGVETIGSAEMDLFPGLVAISRNGAGADAIDVGEADRRNITVLTARGANARGVAELALAHILNGLRGIPRANTELHEGRWERALGREVPDVTLGIVGYGSIGRLVGSFGHSLGATVLAYDPYAPRDPLDPVPRVGLGELLDRSDVVTLHSPPADDGRPVIGAAELQRLPRGAVLVNTARSSLIDPDAVFAALESTLLACYAVDAFDDEPPELTPLLRHPSTILTPHLGGFTGASIERATEQSVSNLLDILKVTR